MERVRGRSVSTAEEFLGSFSAGERRAMAEDLLGVVLHQVVVTGVFHADLHPGNIFVSEEGELGLLDLGAVGRLDRAARTSIGLLLAAADPDPVLHPLAEIVVDVPRDPVGAVAALRRRQAGVGGGGEQSPVQPPRLADQLAAIVEPPLQ